MATPINVKKSCSHVVTLCIKPLLNVKFIVLITSLPNGSNSVKSALCK